MGKVAFLFPGQGAQSVGMCSSLYEHYPIFRDSIEEVEDLVYQKIWPLCFEGPERELRRTVNCQLALFAVGWATLRTVLFVKPHIQPSFCAGLSLGEYNALVAAGILSLKEAAPLVQRRAELMQQACEEKPGKMVAVLGLDIRSLEALLQSYRGTQVLAMANYNAAAQIVVAGEPEAIAWFEKAAREGGARRLVELDVAGAFHTPLMQPAATALEPLIEMARFEYSPVKVVSNVLAEPVEYSEDFRELLVQQITRPVLWMPTIEALDRLGVDCYIEMGPGRVLHGLNRRIGTMARTLSVETVEDIEALP